MPAPRRADGRRACAVSARIFLPTDMAQPAPIEIEDTAQLPTIPALASLAVSAPQI
ncbi:MAG: hypothetical protein AAF329_04885 [Cyanobacteria bacterium P01_A01_bin.17]